MLYDELRYELEQKEKDLLDIKEALNLDEDKKRLDELEKMQQEPSFWDDSEKSAAVLKEVKALKVKEDNYNNLSTLHSDCMTLLEMYSEENDEDLLKEANESATEFFSKLENLKLSTLLNGEYDANSAIVSIHAGAGGTESCDWCSMLYRMYQMYCNKAGFKLVELDRLDGDEAGIKSISFLVDDINAYGYLKSEAGVHRLVRISPFDSSGRRHTSFCAVEVMPQIDEASEKDIEIKEDDLKIDYYRASGAGGQKVNKTSSAVRLTHIPTGIVVSCQVERSQFQNRDVAMRMLKSKLFEIKEREHLEKIEDIKGVQTEVAFGHQIRSYVFMPYTLVKDHRTNFESGNIDAVMNGEIDGFITAFLKSSV